MQAEAQDITRPYLNPISLSRAQFVPSDAVPCCLAFHSGEPPACPARLHVACLFLMAPFLGWFAWGGGEHVMQAPDTTRTHLMGCPWFLADSSLLEGGTPSTLIRGRHELPIRGSLFGEPMCPAPVGLSSDSILSRRQEIAPHSLLIFASCQTYVPVLGDLSAAVFGARILKRPCMTRTHSHNLDCAYGLAFERWIELNYGLYAQGCWAPRFFGPQPVFGANQANTDVEQGVYRFV